MGCVWKRLAAALIFVTVAVATARADSSLLVSREDDDGPPLCLPIHDGAPFHLDFVNSIYQAPVRETFIYDPLAGISLVGVESPSPGVFEYYGLMTDGTGKAALRRALGKGFRVLSHDYRHHRLSTGGRSIDLKNYAVDGKPLIIEARSSGCSAAGR